MWNIFSHRNWPSIPFDEIVRRSRIVVIDDNDFPYLPLFTKDGYTVEKWSDVQDLGRLETGYFDIILLDIQGVGRALSKEQGLGILKHIHSVNPAQIVVAFSNADWSLRYQDFFKLADASLPKSADYCEFKRTVDNLLTHRFELQFYIDRICRLLGPGLQDDPTVRRLSREAILKGSTAKLERYLKKASDKSDAISLSIKVAKVAVALLAGLC